MNNYLSYFKDGGSVTYTKDSLFPLLETIKNFVKVYGSMFKNNKKVDANPSKVFTSYNSTPKRAVVVSTNGQLV